MPVQKIHWGCRDSLEILERRFVEKQGSTPEYSFLRRLRSVGVSKRRRDLTTLEGRVLTMAGDSELGKSKSRKPQEASGKSVGLSDRKGFWAVVLIVGELAAAMLLLASPQVGVQRASASLTGTSVPPPSSSPPTTSTTQTTSNLGVIASPPPTSAKGQSFVAPTTAPLQTTTTVDTTTSVTTTTAAVVSNPAFASITVRVANATGINGVAGRVTNYLGARGFNVVAPVNATQMESSSTIYYAPGFKYGADQVATFLSLPLSDVQPDSSAIPVNAPPEDINVIAGPEVSRIG